MVKRKRASTTRAFEVTKVRRACRHVACRGAVFNSIFARDWMPLGVPETLTRLRRLWHARLSELEHAGWKRVQSRLSMQYMRNCPPFGVFTEDTTRVCRLPILCPFCFARLNVLDSYIRLETALFGSMHRKIGEIVIPSPHLKLIGFTRLYPLWPNEGIEWTTQSRKALIYTIKHLIAKYRHTETDVFSPLGGIVLHRTDMRVDNWPLIRSGVLLCDAQQMSAFPKEWEELREKRLLFIEQHDRSRITKSLLAEVVSRRFRYSAGLLSWPAEDVVAYLHSMRRMRLIAKYGICRHKHSK